MLTIKQPRIERSERNVRMITDIIEDKCVKTVWIEVDNKYEPYLCTERADAFVIGLLHYAMSHNHDIICEVPMGEYLYYQITTYLIDTIAQGSSLMHNIKITADVDQNDLPCAGKVGTGISCGIDSLHVLAALSGSSLTHHKPTHLTFFNVGSHGEGERAKRLFAERKRRAECFCQDYGFELVEVNSNIMDVFPQIHVLTHTFTSMFAVFALQKLYSVYYYASGYPFSAFSLANTYSSDCAYYDLLLTGAFSTDHLRIYSEGGNLSRLEKTRKVVTYPPSYKYLNVCTSTEKNCGRCEKCTRTLLALDVLGALDKYRDVFDIDDYLSHKQYHLKTLYVQYSLHSEYYMELYPYFKHQIHWQTKVRAISRIIYGRLHSNILRSFLKQFVNLFRKKP